MAYIGKQPVVGNFQKCDAITVVNGQAAYTMQVGGVNVNPESENHMLVSLNGVLQAPVDSFTISGSTITFASNLATGDVIDFIMLLGNVLDLGTPSDNTVSLAKLTASGTKDATTFLRGDNTFAAAGGVNTPAFLAYNSSSQSISASTYTKVSIDTEVYDTANAFDNSTNYRFTPQTSGKYFVYGAIYHNWSGNWGDQQRTAIYKNGSEADGAAEFLIDTEGTTGITEVAAQTGVGVIDMNGTTDYLEFYFYQTVSGGTPTISSRSFAGAYRLIGA